jgi:hypothetical protein
MRRLWNNIVPPSSLAHGSNYSLFKEGVAPKWEDPANMTGGKWLLVIAKQNRYVVVSVCCIVLGWVGSFSLRDEKRPAEQYLELVIDTIC